MKLLTLIILTISLTSCDEINLALSELNNNSETSSAMVTTWRVGDLSYGDGDNSITLPLRSGYNYDVIVDWGDGESSEITSDTDTDITHIYSDAGDYTVTIDGLAEAWYFNNSSGDREKIISVSDLGGLGWINLEGAFSGASNLVSFAGGETSTVTSMRSMFQNTFNLVSLDLSTFNTSSVTDMYEMFRSTLSLASLDLSDFDTSSVTNMTYMFYNAQSLISLDLSSFDTSSVLYMAQTFNRVLSLTSLDLSSFDTSNVISMQFMFRDAQSIVSLDLSSFDTSSVLDMYGMFYNASSLVSLDISSFNTSSTISAGSMFFGANSLTTLDLSHFDTSSITNMNTMFYNTSSLTFLNATGWDISNVAAFSNVFTNSNVSLLVTCDQGGSPGVGTLFGETCN